MYKNSTAQLKIKCQKTEFVLETFQNQVAAFVGAVQTKRASSWCNFWNICFPFNFKSSLMCHAIMPHKKRTLLLCVTTRNGACWWQRFQSWIKRRKHPSLICSMDYNKTKTRRTNAQMTHIQTQNYKIVLVTSLEYSAPIQSLVFWGAQNTNQSTHS